MSDFVAMVILLNDGTGHMNPPTQTNPAFGRGEVRLVDVSGDGKLDIVVSGGAAADFNVALGNGDGTFQAPLSFPAVSTVHSLDVADLNGDGRPDVVCSIPSGIVVRLNTGTAGLFGAAAFYTASSSPDGEGLVLGDFTGDGKPDVVQAGYTTNRVYVYPNNGSGAFGTPVSYFTGTDYHVSQLAAADFDRDGKLDLAATLPNQNTVLVYRGNGNGTLQAPAGLTVAGPGSVATTDFDQDGFADLAVIQFQGSRVAVLRGDGAGGFAPAVLAGNSLNPSDVTAADVTGDGLPDLITPSTTSPSSVTITPNTTPVVASFLVSAPASAPAGTPFTVTVTARDAGGAVLTGYVGAVHFTSTDGSAVLPADYRFVAADNGVKTFTVTLGSGPSQTVTVADAVRAGATGSAVVSVPDPIPPGVAGVARRAPAGASTAAASVQYTVTFSEAVTGVDATDFTVAMTGGASGASVAGVTGSGDTYVVTVLTGTGEGTIRLDVADDDTVRDLSGNPLGGAGAGTGGFTSGQAYTIDRTAPAVAVGAPSVALTRGGPVSFTVTYTGADSVTLLPANVAVLSSGSAQAGSVVVSGTGSTRTVTLSNITGDGTLRISLAAGTATDDAGNSAPATGPSATFAVDNTPPAVSTPVLDPAGDSGVSSGDQVTSAAALTFTGTAGGGAVVELFAGTTSLGTTTATGAEPASGTWSLSNVVLPAGVYAVFARVTDAAGNSADSAAVAVTVDRTAPVVQSVTRLDPSPTGLDTVRFLVTFAEPVVAAGVDAADFTVTAAGVTYTSVAVAPSGAGVATAGYVVTLAGVAGDGTLGLSVDGGTATVADVAGNTLAAGFAGVAYAIDNTAPGVAVAVAGGQVSPTNAGPVRFSVTFDEPVTGFGPAAVALTGTAGNLAGATVQVTNPGGDGQAFVVAVSGLTSGGTVTLSVPAGRVTDAAGNANTPGGPATVVYDSVAPVAQSITRGSPAAQATGAASVQFTVTFSEPVAGVDTDPSGGFTNFAVAGTAAGAAVAAAAATGDPRVYTVTVNTGAADGTLRLDLAAVGAIRDAAGNALTGTRAGDETYAVDKTAPTAVFTAVATPRNTPAGSIKLTFTEPVAGLDLADLVLARGGVPVPLTGATLTGGGATYTVTGLAGLTGLDGEYVLSLTAAGAGVADAAGNLLAAGAGTTFVVDATAPTVTFTPSTPGPTVATVVTFTVAFGEPVVGVDTDPAGGFADFAVLTTGDVSGAAVLAVAPTATAGEYLVSVGTGAGVGTLRLQLTGGGSRTPPGTRWPACPPRAGWWPSTRPGRWSP